MNRLRPKTAPCRARLALAVVAALLPLTVAAAPKVEFNADMLFGGAGSLDLSRFEHGDLLPGTYNADVLVNGTLVGRRDLVARVNEHDEVRICLDRELFDLLSLNHDRLEALRTSQDSEHEGLLPLPDAMTCEALSAYVPGAVAEFDVGEQALSISIPQIYLSRSPRGWVAPEHWESGVTAATLGYSFSHSRQRSQTGDYSHSSMTVDAGFNVGEWRLRHNGYLRHTELDGTTYSAGRSYLQRNLPAWGAQLTLGDSSTSGDMFSGVDYRGINIRTDTRMLPDVMREYAPIVTGVAQTNARVTIRQRDYVIYETTVAPGPFEIDDLQSTGSSGDLEVEITEADGRVERFTIPFTSMPQLLRPGQQRYSITAGELREDNGDGRASHFVEATLRRGLSNRFTGYAGVTAAEGYSAAVLGAAWNLPIGSFSGDVTFSDARLPGSEVSEAERRRGQSYRLAFNKALFSDHTNITLAAYRYSTTDFLTLSDAMRLSMPREGSEGYDLVGRQRSRLDLTVNQRLADGKGTLRFTGSTTDYWSDNRRNTTFSATYGNRLGRGTYTISARRSVESSLYAGNSSKATNSLFLSYSLPLGAPPAAPRLDASVERDSAGRSAQRLGVSGALGDQYLGSYHASGSRDSGRNSFEAGANYQFPQVHVTGSYSRTGSTSQLTLGAAGGLVLHGGGLTLAQRMGETMGLVHIPGAAGAGLETMTGVKTDARGYAVVPYLSPFRRNEISVDPSGLGLDVELSSASVSAVPNAGAVVKMVLPTTVGRIALIEALLPDGRPLPFGTDVLSASGEVVGVVGQGSRLWVRGLDEQGELFVQHGADESQRCRLSYDLRGVPTADLLEAVCSPSENVRSASSSED